MLDLPDKLHGVAGFLVLRVGQPDCYLLWDRDDLRSSKVIDEHFLELSRCLAWWEGEFAHEKRHLSVGHA